MSLGVSPVPKKYCNYSCVYCQLGRTPKLQKERGMYFPVEDILAEVTDYLQSGLTFDVLTVVGEGEPTLYLGLEQLLTGLKKITDKPVVVINNSSLLAEEEVRKALAVADIVMPSLDAYDELSFRKINRPLKQISFEDMYQGLVTFSREFAGQLWLEVMLVRGLNDDEASLFKLKRLLDNIRFDRLFLNTPVRPPAEDWVKEPGEEALQKAVEILGGLPVTQSASLAFFSEVPDHYEAILSIIKRHPMNQHEITSFLNSRDCSHPEDVFARLEQNPAVEVVDYKGYRTYRLVK